MRIGRFASAAVLPMLCLAVHGEGLFHRRLQVEAHAPEDPNELCYDIETQVLDFSDMLDAKEYGGLEWAGAGRVIDLTTNLVEDLGDVSKLQENLDDLGSPAAYRVDFDGLGLKSLNPPSLVAPGNCQFGVGLVKVVAPEGGSITFTGVKATGGACTRGPFTFDETHTTEIIDLTGCGNNLKKLSITSSDASHILIDQLQVVGPNLNEPGDIMPPEVFIMSNSPVEAADPKGAIVDFKVAVIDDVDKQIKPVCTMSTEENETEVPVVPGQKLPVGDNFITCTAKDSLGLDNIVTEVITVQDTTAPKFASAKTFVVAPDEKTKTCSYTVQAIDNTKGVFAAECLPASGLACKVGDTVELKCTAEDEFGNSATEGFTMQVRSRAAPTVHVPESVTLKAPTNAKGVPFDYKVSATDGSGAALKATCDHPSGSTFPIGATTVKCVAVDGLLSSERSFLVTVLPPAVVEKPAEKKADIVSSGNGVQAAEEEPAVPIKTTPATSPAPALSASSALRLVGALVVGAAGFMAFW